MFFRLLTCLILATSLCLICCFSGCGGKQEQDSIPINKRLFEALKNNNPDGMSALFPTAEELYMVMRRLNKFYDKENAKEHAEEGAREMGKELMRLRQICKKKGLDWNKASLTKTTARRHFLEEDKEFNHANPEATFMALAVSDGKVSVVILARIGFYGHYENDKEIRTLRIDHGLLLDPLTKEERKLLEEWWPGEDKNQDEKARKILTNGHITREFITHWKGRRHATKSLGTKWIYKYPERIPELTILELHFSKDGVVSNVLIRKEEESKKTPPKESK